MKRVITFITSMLFAMSVYAAPVSLTVIDTGTGLTSFTAQGGTIDYIGTEKVEVNSGFMTESFDHSFSLTNTTSAATTFRLWIQGVFFSTVTGTVDSFSVLVDGIEIASATIPGQVYSIGIFNSILLGAGQTVSMIVKGVTTGGNASYGITLATPIPAALFLFAPALIGFFGLRRRATALSA